MKLNSIRRRSLGLAAGLSLTGFLLTGLLAEDSPILPRLDGIQAPPDQIKALLNRGPLKWKAGLRKDDQRTSTNQKKVAETAYRVKYSYNCRTRWTIDTSAATITIKIRYSQIVWNPEHTIWLATLPEPERFWSSPIVLHELDHLRISSDPRIENRFEQRLREESILVRAINHGDAVNQNLVSQLVKEHVVEIFQEYSDLIAIRYKELDRITNHGQRPVPADSEIAKLLADES